MRRSQLRIEVLGLEEIRELNRLEQEHIQNMRLMVGSGGSAARSTTGFATALRSEAQAATQAARAAAQIAEANARAANANTRAATATERLTQAQNQTTASASRAAAAAVGIHTANARAATAQNQTAASAIRLTTATNQATASASRMGTAANQEAASAIRVDTAINQWTASSNRAATSQSQMEAAAARLAAQNAKAAGSVQSLSQHQSSAIGTSDNLFRSFLRYNVVAQIFEQIGKAAKAAGEEVVAVDYQAARVRRISPSSSRSTVTAAIRSEMAQTGKDADVVGEAYYQIAPFVKDAEAQFSALDSVMKLVIGTEADSKEAARGLMQVYNEFGDQLGANVSDAEKFRRAGELFATAFQSTNTEVNELINSLKYLGPIAAAAKVPLEQTFAFVGALDKAGIRDRMAGTGGSQFLTQMITKYDEKISGISYKGNDYHFKRERTADGGNDVIGTLRNIAEAARSLPTKEAEKFLQAVSGSQQSFRVVGAINAIEAALPDMVKGAAQFRANMDGSTHKMEEMQKVMNETFSVQSARAWKGFLGEIGSALDSVAQKLGIIQKLKDLGDYFEGNRRFEADDAKLGQQLTKQKPLEHAVAMQTITIDALRIMREQKTDLLSQGDMEGGIGKNATGALMALMREQKIPVQGGDGFPFYLPKSSIDKTKAALDQMIPGLKASDERSSAIDSWRNSNKTKAGAAIADHLMDAAKTPEFQASCAYFASAIMKQAGLKVPSIGSASGLRDFLISKGSKGYQAEGAIAGDYAIFHGKQYGTWKDAGGMGYHAAIYMGDGKIRQSSGGKVTERTLSEAEKAAALFYRVPDSLLGATKAIVTPSKKKGDKAAKDAEKARRTQAELIGDEREQLEAQRTKIEERIEAAQRDLDFNPVSAADAARRLSPFVNNLLHLDNQIASLGMREAKLRGEPGKSDKYSLGLKGSNLDSVGNFLGTYGKEGRQRSLEAAQENYDATREQYGLNHPQTRRAAEELQRWQERSTSSVTAIATVKRTGAMASLLKDKANAFGEESTVSVGGLPIPKAMIEAFRRANGSKTEEFAVGQNAYVSGVLQGLEARGKARRLLAPNEAFTDSADYARRARPLLEEQKDIREQMGVLGAIPEADRTSQTREQILSLGKRAEELSESLSGLRNDIEATNFQKQTAALSQEFEQAREQLNREMSMNVFARNDHEQLTRGMMLKRRAVGLWQEEFERFNALPDSPIKTTNLERIREGRKHAIDEQSAFPSDYRTGQFQQTYDRVKGNATGAALDFFHGSGSVTGAIQTMGQSIIDAALTKQIEGWLDPLLMATTNQIEALRGNTGAIETLPQSLSQAMVEALTGTVTPGSENSSALPSSAIGGRAKGGKRMQNMQAIAAGLAGYQMLAGGAQGITAGGAAGSALSGASIFGAIKGISPLAGAGIGLGLNLIWRTVWT